MKRAAKAIVWAVLNPALAMAAFGILVGCGKPVEQEVVDLVIKNGRVMDPESGRDERADVAVHGDRIVAIGKDVGGGEQELDASGLVVAPGFIDLLASVPPNLHAHTHKITDGVTTCFGMHGGPVDLGPYRQELEASGALVNYGTAVGHVQLRRGAGATDRYAPATAEQIQEMKDLAGQALEAGAAGIGFGINYIPGTSYEEVFALFEVAAEHNVACHLHARYKGNVFPETMSVAVMEVIAAAAATGARAQLAHLTSSTVGSAPLCLALIEGAAEHGVDVAFDFHVWTRNQTWLRSALYDAGWQERFGGITYRDIFVAETQERLTKERFEKLRSAPEETLVQTEFIAEEEIEMALRSPVGMISSDSGGLWSEEGHEKETGHPRGTGTFARFLSRYVRERQVVSLMEALGKISLLPAQRLEKSIPEMKKKGRLRVGADADITVFDPQTILERATYERPYLYSDGVRHVLVNGVVVLRDGELVDGVTPGRWLKHSSSTTPAGN
ncbi:MAG: amidohydrolase family protein [Acidobacteriota bacterium]